MGMTSRLTYIDVAKAIFMMIIVMNHTGCIEPFPCILLHDLLVAESVFNMGHV